MAAPLGNQFWKLRSKHGRDKLFSDPEALWEAACEYFEWCGLNPWVKNEAVKSGDLAGQLIQIPTERPFTISGLCIYLGVNTKYFNDFADYTQDKDDDISKGFSEIITRIREATYTQKFEGAAVGAFNANIIARDLGLADKKDLTTAGEKLNALQVEVIHTNAKPKD